METNETTFVLPQDVPLPLQDAVESLYQVIDNASKVRRNTQKMLHFIARCIDIISELKNSINANPSDLEGMMNMMESVGKLDTLLANSAYTVSKEVSLPELLTVETMSTWESSRTEFRALVNEAYDQEFKPPKGWQKEVEIVARLDDYLWVSRIAQDMRVKGIDLISAEKIDQIAARILEEGDQAARDRDIDTAMSYWNEISVGLSTLALSHDPSQSHLSRPVTRDKDIQAAMNLRPEPMGLNSLTLLGDDRPSSPSLLSPVAVTTSPPNVPNEPSSSQVTQVPLSGFAEDNPLVPSVNKNELERKADLPSRRRRTFADVSQPQVGSSNSGAPVSSNAQQGHSNKLVNPQSSVDVARVNRSEQSLDSHSKPRWQMMLHNMQMQGRVCYMESIVADGPRDRQTWTASVWVLDQPNGNVIGTYVGNASTRQAAREEASRQALAALGVY